MTQIVSALPGRIRIRDPLLRKRAVLEQLLPLLENQPGIESLKANPAAGSLVILTTPGTLMETVETQLDEALAQALGAARKIVHTRSANLHRYTKIGMLGSLGASMALIAAGQKKGHALTGSVFLGFLGLHLYHYRRNLLR